MPYSLGPTGLVVKTRAELQDQLSAALRAIYGNDINLAPDTPDGQWMNIIIQAALDLSDLLVQINTQFDPDQAVGAILDQRCAINGIQRQAGTFTVTNITVVTSQSVTLYGIDQAVNTPFTVSDNEGNQWVLQTSVSVGATTSVLSFQSVVPGAVLTVPNTITTSVTVVLGVDSVNNPTTYITLGINEETDQQLRIRRQQSVALSSQGYLAGLLAALENIPAVSVAFVYENVTGTTDSDGIPGHSIWVIVGGSASSTDIANAIYSKRNAGCGLKGGTTFNITQIDGSIFTVRWDAVEQEALFIKFTASSLDGVNAPNITGILAQLPSLFTPGVYEQVNVNDLATLVQQIDPNTLVTNAGFSTTSGGSYTNTLTPSAKNKQFAVSAADTIIIPLIVSPAAPISVAHGATQQFTELGGYSTITWTIHTNNSSGSINSSTGLYTAGATHPVTDTVRATDSLGNFTDVAVTVP